jgi:hypothetical protein
VAGGGDHKDSPVITDLPPADCPWCGASPEHVRVHSVETSQDGKTAIFDIECSNCLTRDRAQIMKRVPDWMEALRG